MANEGQPVAAPPSQPPLYGLIAAAPVVDDPAYRWRRFSFPPEQCGGGGRLVVECAGGTALVDVDTAQPSVSGDPFLVWAGDECSSFGFDARDYEGRARRNLAAVESFELAEELWTGDLSAAENLENVALTDASSDTLTSGPSSLSVALACVEQALGRALKGRRGMVHVTPQVLVLLAERQLVRLAGNLWVTPMGTIVVADAGYDGSGPGGVAAGASQWMFGSSMIQVRRGEVVVLPGSMREALDRAANTVTYVAERLVAYQWDGCGHVAAELDVGVCAVGGAS